MQVCSLMIVSLVFEVHAVGRSCPWPRRLVVGAYKGGGRPRGGGLPGSAFPMEIIFVELLK